MNRVRDLHQFRKNEILLTFALVLALLIGWEVRHALLLIYVSVVFAIVFTPVVKWVQRLPLGKWHPSAGAAVLVLVAVVALVLVSFGIFVIPSVSSDVEKLAQDLPHRILHVENEVARLPFGQHLISAMHGGNLTSAFRAYVPKLIGAARNVTGAIADVFLVIILTAYFIVDRERSFNWLLAMLPVGNRHRFRAAFKKSAGRMQNWLRGQALLMLILGTSSFVVFWAIGVPYSYALAFFAALANFVPVLGPVATVVVAGAIAATDSWMKVLGVVVFYLVYQQVENSYLTPRIMKSTVALPSVAVIVALAIGGTLAGVLGAIVAVPTAALIATLIDAFNSGADEPDRSQDSQIQQVA